MANTSVLPERWSYCKARFGKYLGPFLYRSRLVNTYKAESQHYNINHWSDQEIVSWRDAQMSTFSGIAVAASIFASVGLTALTLPSLDASHWAAKALISVSMGLGALSMLTAVSLQQQLGFEVGPTNIRLFLSRGLVDTKSDKYDHSDFDTLPLESSIPMAERLDLPAILLTLAAALFLVGFTLYLGYGWRNNIDRDTIAQGDQRNIFVIFVAIIGSVVVYEYGLRWWLDFDSKKIDSEFESKPADFERELKEFLRVIQDGAALSEDEQPSDAQLLHLYHNLLARLPEMTSASSEADERSAEDV